MLDTVQCDNSGESQSRVIKRYRNRKLYDTRSSKYVTLLQIAEMVREGDEVRIIDNRTKEDKTQVTLALIISEELKSGPGGIPLTVLRSLIRHDSSPPPSGGEDAEQAETDVRLAKLVVPGRAAFNNQEAHVGDQSKGREQHGRGQARVRFEEWQTAMDERMKTLPDSATVSALQNQVQRLNERLAELERRLPKNAE